MYGKIGSWGDKVPNKVMPISMNCSTNSSSNAKVRVQRDPKKIPMKAEALSIGPVLLIREDMVGCEY